MLLGSQVRGGGRAGGGFAAGGNSQGSLHALASRLSRNLVVCVCAGHEQLRPWIREHIHTPAAQDFPPGATRKRPLIYV